jgi:hypothetical protein
MNNPNTTSKSTQTLNIGIYGRTQAGKTRFLFQLFNYWERNRRLLAQSEEYHKFVSLVQDEIDKHDHPRPTVAKFEGIRAQVRLDNDVTPWELVFRDLAGERLEEELPPGGTVQRDGEIASQVGNCNAFLFFFDPTSSEKPADIDNHHQRECKRAVMFVEHVLKHRQNRHLPIAFVLTHFDCWECDPDILTKAERWTQEVHARLVELYDHHLRRYYPKSLTERNRIFFNVSSIGPTPQADEQLEKVIEQLIDLHKDSTAHQSQLRKAGKYLPLVLGGVAFVVLLAIIGGLLSSPGGSPPLLSKKTDRVGIAEMSEQQIHNTLDELDRLLKAHPQGTQLPSVEEAKKINHHLRWLTQRLELEAAAKTDLSEKTQQRMRTTLDSVAQLIQAKAESREHSPAVLTLVLAAYLEDLADLGQTAPTLAKVQARYWQLYRAYAVEQVGWIIKRRGEVASPPIDTLSEIVGKLRDLEQEVARCKVYGPQARNELVQDIQTAATFCEDRKNTKTYPVKFRVVSARLKTNEKVGEDLNSYWHLIRFESPGQSEGYPYALRPDAKGEYDVSFATKQQSYEITLGLGTPLTCNLYKIRDATKDDWSKLYSFDLIPDPGPLAPLGLPLIQPNQPAITKLLQREGMELKLEFFDFRVPRLLLEAATSRKERKP